MAVVNLSVTIPDGQMSRVQAACRAHFGQVPSGPPDPVTGVVPMRDMTNAEIVERIRQDVISTIKGIVWTQEAEAKRREAEAIAQVDAT